MSKKLVRVTLELTTDQAAALHRFVDKASYQEAHAVTYGHANPELRSAQAYEIISATAVVQRALQDVGVGSWPWIETGSTTD